MALIWLLACCGQIHLPAESAWKVAIGLSMVSLMLLIYGLPITMREVLKPFKRVPSPDLN
jgi:hypothetical protein